MSIVVIYDEGDRNFVRRLIDKARPGTRIQMLQPRRTDEQNARLWAMLADVARQVTHGGRNYDPEQWRLLFMHACGQEVEFAPSLDGSTFIPFQGHSSKMSSTEMGELIEFISCWGAENGVEFRE